MLIKSLENMLITIVTMGTVFSTQIICDIPFYDFPDIKDSPQLFPNLNPEQISYQSPYKIDYQI